MRMDIVTVFHDDHNFHEQQRLRESIERHEPMGGFNFIAVDNRRENRGFGPACNLGAFQEQASSPIIGFLNPDTTVHGSFIGWVRDELADPQAVITGHDFGKPANEKLLWGCDEWVCGAAFFVKRDWFTAKGGFDERYIWSHEETDLIRQAQVDGLKVTVIDIPVHHESPLENSPEDAAYKQHHFERSRQLYVEKWGLIGA